MIFRTARHSFFSTAFIAAVVAGLTGVFPADASAQYSRPKGGPRPALGETYRVEIAGAWWKPNLFGSVSSDRLNLIGSKIDLVDDLGFGAARFRDVRVTVRGGRAHKIRFQYTPLEYAASGELARQVTFAGHVFDVALPIDSKLGWKVWRIGYEWDFLYKPRGFVGVLFEARKTELTAALTSLAVTGEVAAQAPLPSIGVVARVYPLPDLALHFELGGLKVPPIRDRYEGSYSDMEISATVNVTNNLGVTAGWRRLDTNIRIERDFGDLKFQGIWFGGAIRY
jgi:hypothetical protein